MTVARNPIPPRDERFTLDPTPWVEGTVLEHYADDAGFFHVTTNRDRVFADGRLRSRQDVGIVGLGGGNIDRGYHVSFVVDWNRAAWLYGAMKALREELEPGGSAKNVLRLVLEWTGFPDQDPSWQDLDYRLDMEDSTVERELRGMYLLITTHRYQSWPDSEDAPVLVSAGEWRKVVPSEWWDTPERRYDLAVELESRIRAFLPDEAHRDEPNTCVPTIGFTASFERFMQIDPAQISIVQAAIRVGAREADFIPDECELRFKPEDVSIVAVDCQDKENVVR